MTDDFTDADAIKCMFPKSKIAIVYALYKQGELKGYNLRRNIDMLYFLCLRGHEYIDDYDKSQIIANIESVVDDAYEGNYDKVNHTLNSMWENLSETNARLIRDIKGTQIAPYMTRPHVKAGRAERRGAYRYPDYSTYSGYDELDAWGIDMNDAGCF